MNGEPSDLQVRRTEPDDVPPLSLVIQRVLDEEARIPLHAEFRFDPCMPLIVSVTFTHEQGIVTWNIGRELLHRGLSEESGNGDVQVWPTPFDEEKAWLLLESTDRTAVFELPVPAVAQWIDSTYERVSAEAESDALDWDGFLQQVLDGKDALPD